MAASTSEMEVDDRLYPIRPLLAASCAVVRDGRVLIARRARPPMTAVWSLPGGLVEPGERLAEAALRELQEEVGITATIAGFAGHAEYIEREGARLKRHFVIAAFAARWLDGEPRTGPEAAAVRWVEPADLGHLATTDGLADIVAEAVRLVPGD